ncbi:hypothetical protein AAVH_10382 [Aphelenchoides avenae]|nr:hypothetical protein AAVH_10382 [Aphelenchus avenae]
MFPIRIGKNGVPTNATFEQNEALNRAPANTVGHGSTGVRDRETLMIPAEYGRTSPGSITVDVLRAKRKVPVVHEHNDHLYVYNHLDFHDNDYHAKYDDEHEYNNDIDALDNDYNDDKAIHDNYDHPIDDIDVNYYDHQQSDYH